MTGHCLIPELAIEKVAEAPPGFVQQRNKVKGLAHPICDVFTGQFILQWGEEVLSEIKTPIIQEKPQRGGSVCLRASSSSSSPESSPGSSTQWDAGVDLSWTWCCKDLTALLGNAGVAGTHQARLGDEGDADAVRK